MKMVPKIRKPVQRSCARTPQDGYDVEDPTLISSFEDENKCYPTVNKDQASEDKYDDEDEEDAGNDDDDDDEDGDDDDEDGDDDEEDSSDDDNGCDDDNEDAYITEKDYETVNDVHDNEEAVREANDKAAMPGKEEPPMILNKPENTPGIIFRNGPLVASSASRSGLVIHDPSSLAVGTSHAFVEGKPSPNQDGEYQESSSRTTQESTSPELLAETTLKLNGIYNFELPWKFHGSSAVEVVNGKKMTELSVEARILLDFVHANSTAMTDANKALAEVQALRKEIAEWQSTAEAEKKTTARWKRKVIEEVERLKKLADWAANETATEARCSTEVMIATTEEMKKTLGCMEKATEEAKQVAERKDKAAEVVRTQATTSLEQIALFEDHH